MSGLQQSNVESPKSKASRCPRTISLSPFDASPANSDAGLQLDFEPGLMIDTRPASLFTAECHVLRDMFAKGVRA
jgi:hypothetical protein